jgi:holliday junction DNA helicase RuvA
MIGYIKGVLLEKHAPVIIIDVNGLGYEVLLPVNSFYKLPRIGESLSLYTHFIVREDGHFLYGFFEKQQRELFRALIKINGVGPKLALAILSGMEPSVFVRSILEESPEALEKLPGIGKKTAMRLIMEMRDKLNTWEIDSAIVGIAQFDNDMRDAISALIALGYKPQDAQRALIPYKDQNMSSEALIKAALKNIK